MHPPLRQQISDIVTSLLSLSNLSVNLTSTSITDMKAFVRVSRVLFRPFAWKAELLNPEITGRQYDQRKKLQEALDQEDWYATVEDLERVWTNALRHRIFVGSGQPSLLCFRESEYCAASTTNAKSVAEEGNVLSSGREEHIRTAWNARELDNALARTLQGILARCT